MMSAGAKIRADVFLVRNGYAATRAEAQFAIRAGRVRADGRVVAKASEQLDDSAAINYEKAHPYVSRGALKLIAALDRFELSAEGKVCLDIGASTGGFTQVLLERGAAKVYAIDVGQRQFNVDLAHDARVVSREGVNARDLSRNDVPDELSAIVADVSFISLKLALPPALELAVRGAWLVALVKPQFEVGREKIGKGGIVRDASARESAVEDFMQWLSTMSGWSVIGRMESPIAGGDGNIEFLVAARKS
jgi:23S rRNA (cytidine1920-2'-O)/16S rRNA (cytidine1409-2'-O)-methyltransferase